MANQQVKWCPKCGKQTTPAARFCEGCGHQYSSFLDGGGGGPGPVTQPAPASSARKIVPILIVAALFLGLWLYNHFIGGPFDEQAVFAQAQSDCSLDLEAACQDKINRLEGHGFHEDAASARASLDTARSLAGKK